MTVNCDVLVVGCGPAGASAARAAAVRGAKVICIEKKSEIGVPVQCAEGVGTYLFPFLPFKIPKNQLKWRINGISFWVDGETVVRKGRFWSGYTLNRDEFEKWLVKEAVKAGVSVRTNASLVGLKRKNKNVEEAVVIQNGRKSVIKAKTIVAADGSESAVLSLLGLYKRTKWNTAEVYSWELRGLELKSPHLEQVYLGDFAPGGYGYIFPKSRDTANVGVGAAVRNRPIKSYYDAFTKLPQVKEQLAGAIRVKEKTKRAVWGNITDELVRGNVITAGDAANHNLKPFIEGILPAVVSGDLAGELAHAISTGKKVTSKQYAERFELKLRPYFGFSNAIQKKCNQLFRMKHKKKHVLFAGLAAQLFELEELDELKRLDYEALKVRFVEKSLKP